MNRSFLALILSAFITMSFATAQAQAQTITVRGARGTACCTNSQLLWFEGANFLFNVNRDNPRAAYQVFALGAAGESESIQINYVDSFRLWATTRNHAFAITGFRLVGNGIDQTIAVTTGNPVAAPSLLTEGYFSFAGSTNLVGEKFNGTISFPSRSDLGFVLLFGAGFGSVVDWIVTVEGTSDAGESVSFDFPARAFPLGQPFGFAHLSFAISGQPNGTYNFTARGGGFTTNTTQMRIERN